MNLHDLIHGHMKLQLGALEEGSAQVVSDAGAAANIRATKSLTSAVKSKRRRRKHKMAMA